MKKMLSILSLLLAVVTSMTAQTAQLKIKAKEEEVPLAVVEAFRKDFTGAPADGWIIVPAAVVGHDYSISEYDNLNGEKPTFYTVTLKGPNTKEEAVYDHSGKLVHSKEIIDDAALPTAVRDAIAIKYPGYAFMKDQEVVKTGKTNITHYRVLIQKGTEKKTVAVDTNGKILKHKKLV